jgi:hypothetical protein
MSTQHAAPVQEETPAKELVPDISLDEYVHRFRYEPPADPSEVTMRGDAAPSAEPHDPAATATGGETLAEEEASAPGEEREPIDAEEIAFRNKVEAALHSRPPAVTPVESTPEARIAPEPPKIVSPVPPPPADSIASRLGLEPESPAEDRVQRPRFLDINEPAKESRPAATSGTASIVGPSFLGLSDAPLIAAEGLSPEVPEDDDTPRRSHWRGWLAVTILLIFAALGVVQWRAQAAQFGTGPLQMIKAKIDYWRHATAKPATTDQAASTTAPPGASSQPQTEAAQQPAPQVPPPQETASAAGITAAPANTSSSQPGGSPAPAAPASAAPAKPTASAPAQSPPTVANSASSSPAPAEKPSAAPPGPASGEAGSTSSKPPVTTADNTAPKPARRENQAAVTSGGGTPGTDEMAKAKDASDSTAAAAWLWKATAKGNPEAPVQLADMYIKGNGVPRSCEQAVVLLKTAAEKENALARNRLASMYATGNCVSRNRVEAYRWLSAALAANPNSQWAQQNRDLIWNQMTPDEQSAAQKYR